MEFLNQNLSGTDHDFKHLASLHNASVIILTIILAFIAWVQLRGISETGRASFLLRIDERLGDENIIQARIIIHHLYMESKRKNKKKNFSEDQHCEEIANKIYLLGEEVKDKKKREQYILLLNFLDFLETISLFCNKNYIDINDLDDLMNQSLEFFYLIFEKRIHERRRKYKDPTFYVQFEELIKRLKCIKHVVAALV